MSYGSVGFTIVAAIAKIAFMILGFLMRWPRSSRGSSGDSRP
jgi:hypothetical protein